MQKKSTKPNDWSFERTNERIGSRKMSNNNDKKKKNAYGIFIRLSAFDWNSFRFSCLLTVARQWWAAASHGTLNSTKIYSVSSVSVYLSAQYLWTSESRSIYYILTDRLSVNLMNVRALVIQYIYLVMCNVFDK